MLVTRVSKFSGKTHTIDLPITQDQLETYGSGRQMIQDCFPKLTKEQREFIKTGVTPEEWRKVFG